MDFLLNAALLIGILGAAFFITNWYATAYITCRGCGTMNARRRAHCRKCGAPLGASE
jgi:ribosomal protein L40E